MCIFCKIINGEISAKKIFEDEHMLIFCDLHPMAKHHFLMISKEHFADFSEMSEKQAERLGLMFKKLSEIAPKIGLQNGYRCVINQGKDAGQSVFHLHVHILGGEELSLQFGK